MDWFSIPLIASLGLFAVAEWVEIPQFSDQQKVYRAPNFQGPVLHQEVKTANDSIKFDQPVIMNKSNEDITTTIESAKMKKILTSTDLLDSSKPINEYDENKFLDYLPIDLLKQVHKTLKFQPSTLKGKIRFLKVFEHTLISEIESRLNAEFVSPRLPREAKDHYDVDYHDDKIGFPSLEGTLMAISFLTFAVYLIRLVMMLFRNAGAIGITPIIIGRKKKSIEDFNDETVRILSYLDSTFPLYN